MDIMSVVHRFSAYKTYQIVKIILIIIAQNVMITITSKIIIAINKFLDVVYKFIIYAINVYRDYRFLLMVHAYNHKII